MMKYSGSKNKALRQQINSFYFIHRVAGITNKAPLKIISKTVLKKVYAS
jgi:hypothetical protein